MKLTGIFPATVTPMDSQYRIDYDELKKYLTWLYHEDVDGIAVNVNIGEGLSLTSEERTSVIKIARSIFGDRPIITGIIGASTAMTIQEAKNAKLAGADYGMIFPNRVFTARPLDPAVPANYYFETYSQSKLPLVLFQLKQEIGGAEYDMDTLLQIGKSGSIAAIKEASFDFTKYARTYKAFKEKTPNVSFLTGNDTFLFESFIRGADGALIGFGTLEGARVKEMLQLVKAGKITEAKRVMDIIQPLADLVFEPPEWNARARIKRALYLKGVIREECTYVRPPLTQDKSFDARLRPVLEASKGLTPLKAHM
jgi:4-hydroxy-tetrahydrodipicolinate synthase